MLDDVARRYSLPVPIADVVYSVPYDAFIGRNTKGGFVGARRLTVSHARKMNLLESTREIPSSRYCLAALPS